MSKARILLVDDHAVLRAGLHLLIDNESDLEVVGEGGSGSEAIQLAEKLQPDVILLDLNMPDIDGLSALPRLRTVAPKSRVLVLTMHDDASYLQQTLKDGAAGYVLKKAVDTELLMAIRTVLRGETYVHSAMTLKLLQTMNSDSKQEMPDPWKELSEREFDVLKMVAMGYTNQEIAEQLFLSVKTVETYRGRGMEKLGLETRAQLVQSALKYHHLD